MLKEIDNYDWAEAFGEGGSLAVSPRVAVPLSMVSLDGVSREAVATIIACDEGENDGPDWVGVFQLKDLRFVTVEAGCDYTGWDCQANGDMTVSVSINDAVRYGLTERARERLGFKVTPLGIEFTPKAASK